MTHIAIDPRFEQLVDLTEPVREIATGCTFTEGPLWHPREKFLLFSDIPGDVRRRWSEDAGVSEVRRPSNKCNGMTYDGERNLIVCEHSTSRLVRENTDGTVDVLASHFEGQELNSPNDVIVAHDGSIYFSDPWYGRMPVFGVERERQLGFQGVYRMRRGAVEADLLVPRDLFDMPNGLCFSPDERTLYVNDTVQFNVRAFPVLGDGTLGAARLFAEGLHDDDLPGVPDGMKCDAQGNVWVTAPGGVWVFDCDGMLLGKLVVPQLVANLHWGESDFQTLFLAASTSVYSLRTRVRARVEPFMRGVGA